jgi:L-iditol 2-dehydrogenase
VDVTRTPAATSAVPKTTRAAEYLGNGNVRVTKFPLPAPGQGEITVRIRACGICASEMLRWYADGKAPFVLGHEPVGEIVALGEPAAPPASPFKLGQRVFVHHHAPCMQCRHCARGDYVQCTTWRTSRLLPGAMSEFATVPRGQVDHDVLPVPDELSDDTATLIEPLATVVKSVRRSGLRTGDRVLVIGLGAMGMLHALVARERGAGTVIGADRSAFRLAKANAFCIDQALDVRDGPLEEQLRQRTGAAGAEIVFVTPGSLEALQAALSCVARGGTLVVFTPLAPLERWPLDVHDLFFKDQNLVTSYSAGPDDTRAALALLAAGLPVEPIFTHRFPLEKVSDAYAALKDVEASLKVLVYP